MLRGRHKHIILFSKSCDVQFFWHIFWWRPGHLHIGYVRGVLGWSLTFVHWSSLIDRTATTLQLLVVNRNPFLAIRSSHELCWSYCLIWEDEIYWIIVLHFCRRIWVCCQKTFVACRVLYIQHVGMECFFFSMFFPSRNCSSVIRLSDNIAEVSPYNSSRTLLHHSDVTTISRSGEKKKIVIDTFLRGRYVKCLCR